MGKGRRTGRLKDSAIKIHTPYCFALRCSQNLQNYYYSAQGMLSETKAFLSLNSCIHTTHIAELKSLVVQFSSVVVEEDENECGGKAAKLCRLRSSLKRLLHLRDGVFINFNTSRTHRQQLKPELGEDDRQPARAWMARLYDSFGGSLKTQTLCVQIPTSSSRPRRRTNPV